MANPAPAGERLALTRAQGGAFGRSWMEAAAAEAPIARLWLQRDAMDATVETALAFAALGEHRAARETLQALAARQRHGFAAYAADPLFPPDARHLIWSEWSASAEGRARAAAEIAALPAGDPQIGRVLDRAASAPDTDAWLAAAPIAAPLRATCAAFCPATPLSCRRAAWILIGGQPALATFGTPSETLVSPEVWTASQRGRKALLRVPAARPPFGYVLAAEVSRADTCLGGALAAETERFFR